MTTKLLRLNSLRIRLALCIPFVLLPITVLGSVSFPSNPQTSAECDVPVAEMRAMEKRETALRRQKHKEAEAVPYETEGERYRALTALMAEHGKEAGRIRDELRALEKTCRAAAQANVQRTTTLLQELRNGFVQANNAYENAKAIYARFRNSPYTERNEAFSADLGGAMNVAKQYILGLVPKSQIVGAIQDASIDKLKLQIQQLNGDMAALESAIQSVRAEAPPTKDNTASVPLPRRGGSSGSEMFQDAIKQAEQDEKDRPAREARERAAKAAAVTAKAAAVTAEARQTPEDRLRKNYDQRITAAREQCAASKESCDSGCTGVAVVGLLTMFASKGAGADEASSQIQQCSNRCDGAKSSCDQQVSALEQEKAQAIADSRAPRERTVSAPVASGDVNACAPDPGLFQTYVEAMKEWARVIGRPEASVSVHRETLRQVRAQHIGWSDEMIRNQVEVQSRPHKSTGPAGPHNAALSKIFVQMLKCETGQRQTATASTSRNAGSAQVSVGGGQGSGGAGDCKARYDDDEAKNGPIVQRIQNTSSAVGQMQLLLGMLDRRISLLEQYCRGQPQYAEYAGNKQQRAATMNNCRGIANNPGDCVAK